MANIPQDLKYTKNHEWIKVEEDIATEGITDYAQSELSDIVMIELPQVGRQVKQGEVIGTIEAVKAVADLYAAVSGEIAAVNDQAIQAPDIINKEPYKNGWMIKIKLSDKAELDSLLDARVYQQLITGEDK